MKKSMEMGIMLSNFKWCCMWRYDKMLRVISEE